MKSIHASLDLRTFWWMNWQVAVLNRNFFTLKYWLNTCSSACMVEIFIIVYVVFIAFGLRTIP